MTSHSNRRTKHRKKLAFGKRTVYFIDGEKYYRLTQVCPEIGLTYCEVYHNYDKWYEALGLLKHGRLFLVNAKYAKVFINRTPNYVPREYANKRYPTIRRETKEGIIEPPKKMIRRTIWIKRYSSSEKMLDTKGMFSNLGIRIPKGGIK